VKELPTWAGPDVIIAATMSKLDVIVAAASAQVRLLLHSYGRDPDGSPLVCSKDQQQTPNSIVSLEPAGCVIAPQSGDLACTAHV